MKNPPWRTLFVAAIKGSPGFQPALNSPCRLLPKYPNGRDGAPHPRARPTASGYPKTSKSPAGVRRVPILPEEVKSSGPRHRLTLRHSAGISADLQHAPTRNPLIAPKNSPSSSTVIRKEKFFSPMAQNSQPADDKKTCPSGQVYEAPERRSLWPSSK
jgi:hypothetical protein